MSMTGCAALQQLPDSMGALTALTRLDLTHCSSLHTLPDSLTLLTRLSEFSRYGCASLELSFHFAAWTAVLYCRRIEDKFSTGSHGVTS